VGRQAVLLDPGFPDQAERGLELARQIAHLSYRAEPGLVQRQGRRLAPDAAVPHREWSSRTPYRMQTYLEHQGAKLRRRFDARSYLAQMDAMDHHDLARVPPAPEAVESWRADAPRRRRPSDGPFHGWEALPSPDPETSWGLSRLQARVLAVSIDTDQLYFPEHMVWLTERLRVLGLDAQHRTLSSAHGHDAFLIEWGPMAGLLAEALALPPPGLGGGGSPRP